VAIMMSIINRPFSIVAIMDCQWINVQI